jgi:hypothetical protein
VALRDAVYLWNAGSGTIQQLMALPEGGSGCVAVGQWQWLSEWQWRGGSVWRVLPGSVRSF